MAARAKRRRLTAIVPAERPARKTVAVPLETAGRPPEVPASFWVDADGTARRDLPVRELRAAVEHAAGMLWVEIDSARPEQLALLRDVFGFHPLSIEDTQNPNSRVKVEEFPDYLLVIIRGMRFLEETEDPYDLETYNVCFFIGTHFLVTVHGGQVPAISEVAHRLSLSPDLLRRGPARLAHAIMDGAIDAYFPLVEQIDEFVDGLEERVFRSGDPEMLQDIFAVKRLVLSLRRHLAPQREVFNILTNRPSAFMSAEAQAYYRDLYDHQLRITDALEVSRDLLSSTLDAYLTQVSNRLGRVTQGLSVVATLSIPFVVVSGMWGMNVQQIPLAAHPHAFWWMLGFQLLLGAVLLLLLRWRKIL